MKKYSKLSSLALVALLTISTLLVFSPMAVKASNTVTLEAINPLDGTHDFNFTSETKHVGEDFVVDVTVADSDPLHDMDLQNWQINFTWDASLLDFVSADLPNDHVFSPIDKAIYPLNPGARSMVTAGPTVGVGSVIFGCTYINVAPYPYWTFNGTGRLCTITLRIKQGVSVGGPTEVSCDLTFAKKGIDTFLVDGHIIDIDFTIVPGHYNYVWVEPPAYPSIYIKPAVEKPMKKGDVFGLEIHVDNVYAGWEIIGFQFSLMWNTTMITPAKGPYGNYFDNGTFLEGFDYKDGTLYAADINKHVRVPPLHSIPDGYNFSMFGEIILPDPLTGYTWHSPFPHTSPDGLLMTVYFEATYDTISPLEAWTWIEFINYGSPFFEDCFALNKYQTSLPVSTTPCHYRAPQKILGLGIDLYTQYDQPYGGQGLNMPSDMFSPQQQVDLFAYVSYNEYPVQQKLVGYEIRHNSYNFTRECTTDELGIAHVAFRLPWPCEDPESEIFGKWYVIATVEVAGQVKNDTLAFWVWWPVDVLTVEPKHTEFIQRKTGGDPLQFNVTYLTYSMRTIPVVVTVTVYDELGFFIGYQSITTTVGWGEYKYYDYMACETPPVKTYIWDPIIIPLPTNAVVGKGVVFANAFNKLPWNGGTPYCPEVTNTIDFYIKKPT
jgi:hypothetical protein